MGERYTRIFTLPQGRLYQTGAPVLLLAGALLKDTQTGRVLAQLKFQSIDNRSIKAMKVALAAFDSFGSVLMGVDEFQYLDLNVGRNESFGSKTAIPMPSSDTRSFSCRCLNVVFTDGSTWTASGEAWLPLVDQSTLEQSLGNELADQFRRDTNQKAPYSLAHDRDLWYCVCGAVNHDGEAACCACDAKRQTLADAADPALLRERLTEYQHQQAEQAAREAEERAKREAEAAQRRRRIKKKVSVACIVLLAGLLVFAGVYLGTYFAADKAADRGEADKASSLLFVKGLTNRHDPSLVQYVQAAQLQAKGAYKDASDMFAGLGAYKDAAQRALDTKFTYGEAMFSAKEYDEAIQAFGELAAVSYGNAAQRQLDASFEKAESLLSAAQYDEAISLFGELADANYANAAQRRLDASFEKAESLLSAAQYDEAISLFGELADAKYANAAQRQMDAKFEKAKMLVAKKDYDAAIYLLSSLRQKAYPGAKDVEYATRYEYATSCLAKGEKDEAEAQFKFLASYNYLDSKMQWYDLLYDKALSYVDKKDYSHALTNLWSLSRNKYTKADAVIKKIYTTITTQGESGLRYSNTTARAYWKKEYDRTHASDDHDMLLLALHNALHDYGEEIKMALSPSVTWPFDGYYNGDVKAFYAELKASKYASKCTDQCYDEVRLLGRWSGSGHYFNMNADGHIYYDLPWVDLPDDYYVLYAHKITIYTQDGKTSKDLFKITFHSDTEATFYCFKDGKSYKLKKYS